MFFCVKKEIVNGLRTRNGVNVQSRAMEDPKTEHEHYSNLLLTEEWIVLEKQLNSEIAICMVALVYFIHR